MALLEIVTVPHEALRERAEEVTLFDQALADLAENMIETMYEHKGIGLAANQVNVLKRLIVVDCSENLDSPLVLVNPEFIFLSDEKEESEEGCLSLPTLTGGPVERSLNVTMKAQDLKGEFFEVEASDLFARCLQHEVDHLNGVLFIDYLSRLKQERILKKLERVLRERERDEA